MNRRGFLGLLGGAAVAARLRVNPTKPLLPPPAATPVTPAPDYLYVSLHTSQPDELASNYAQVTIPRSADAWETVDGVSRAKEPATFYCQRPGTVSHFRIDDHEGRALYWGALQPEPRDVQWGDVVYLALTLNGDLQGELS